MAGTTTAVAPDPEPTPIEAQGFDCAFPASYWFEDQGGLYLAPTEASASKVIGAVAARRAKISKCWNDRVGGDPGGEVEGDPGKSMSVLVTPGAAWKVEVIKESLGDPSLVACVSKALKGILFPGVLHLEDGTKMKKGWSLGLILSFPLE